MNYRGGGCISQCNEITRAAVGNDFLYWELFLRELDTMGMHGVVWVGISRLENPSRGN